MTSGSLFTPIFVPEAVQDAVAGDAWLRAMLDVEAALAAAEAAEGVIPAAAADAIAAATPDVGELGVAARAAGNPVVPLVAALREAVGGDEARFVHYGATSQDILDSAAMLVAARALEPVLAELDAVVEECARLAREHRGTLMAGRTLLQQAVPVTFGLKAAGWLAGVAAARTRLRELHGALPAQLGGAAGTLAALGDRGPAVLAAFARELGLAEPALPWHGARGPVAELGAALAVAAGARREGRARHRAARADRGRRGGRGERRRPRRLVGDAAQAQPGRRRAGAGGGARGARRGGRAAGGDGRRARARGRRLAQRVDARCRTRWRTPAARRGRCTRRSSGLEVDAERMRANLDLGGSDEARDPAAHLGATDAFIDRALRLA